MVDKKVVLQMVITDTERIVQEADRVTNVFEKCEADNKTYIDALLKQISKGTGGTLLAKTPKVNRKKNTKIKAIPENEEMELDISDSSTNVSTMSTRSEAASIDVSDGKPTRSRRGASVKAADNIRKQQSINLGTKMRRPSSDDNEVSINKVCINFFSLSFLFIF